MRAKHAVDPRIDPTGTVQTCTTCADVAEHASTCWFPCEEPERPLDLHGIFSLSDCADCRSAWRVLGLPREGIPEKLSA